MTELDPGSPADEPAGATSASDPAPDAPSEADVTRWLSELPDPAIPADVDKRLLASIAELTAAGRAADAAVDADGPAKTDGQAGRTGAINQAGNTNADNHGDPVGISPTGNADYANDGPARDSEATVTELGVRPPARGPWRWVSAAAAAAVIVGALGGVGALISRDTGGADPVTLNAQTKVQPIITGSDYQAQNVAVLVPTHLMRGQAHPAATSQQLSATFMADADGIQSCIDGVGEAIAQLRMIDLARYDSVPSAVMAFIADDQATTADVVIVGEQCSRAQPEIRLRTSVQIMPVKDGR